MNSKITSISEESKILLEKIKEDYATSEARKQVDKYLALVEKDN